MAVQFNFQKTTRLDHRKALKSFIETIFRKEGSKMGDLGVVFCDDLYLLEINKSYLDHNYFTDIITFDLTEIGSKAISGEIYISIDRVKENAVFFQTSFTRELHRVMFHGVLHLLAYKDKTEPEKRKMRAKEEFYLERYFERST
jgi:rRNA maturation RNase YbeY